ncbi:Leucine-rich repeat serine/threonine-protein kinase 2 [Phlyctochytrium planicorne]|nr:Leucine-rich repeat serine/threonine-protein kinase 2 [Phlyctochytrium planicorne]
MLQCIGSIIKAGFEIKDLADRIKDNNNQAECMANRILDIGDVVKTRRDKKEEQKLKTLLGHLEKLKEYMEKLDKMNSIMRTINSKSIQKTLSNFNTYITNSETDLNLKLQMDNQAYQKAFNKSIQQDIASQASLMKDILANVIKGMGLQEEKFASINNLVQSEIAQLRINLMDDLEAVLVKRMEERDPAIVNDPLKETFVKDLQNTLQRVKRQSGLDSSMSTVGKGWFIASDEITIGACIGQGGFGTVYEGYLHEHTKVAIKRVHKPVLNDADKKTIMAEVDTWFALNHPHIVRLIGANVTDIYPFMVMDQMTNGTILDYVRKNPREAVHLLFEAALGVGYMHRKLVSHGDLKALNILIDAAGTAHVADFGFSKSRANVWSTTTVEQPQKKTGGTMRWASPEKLRGEPNFDRFKADDERDDDIVRGHITNGIQPARPNHVNGQVWNLMVRMWDANPEKRPSMDEVANELKLILENKQPVPTSSASLSSDVATSRPRSYVTIDPKTGKAVLKFGHVARLPSGELWVGEMLF